MDQPDLLLTGSTFSIRESRFSQPSPAHAFGAMKSAWLASPFSEGYVIDGALAGITFSIGVDDPALLDPLFLMFGGSAARRGPVREAAMSATVRTVGAPDGWGILECGGTTPMPVDGREFTFAISLEDGPFRSVTDEGWTAIAFRDAVEPMIAFDGEVLMFRLDAEWQKAIVIYLFCRLQRARRDAIFLHAGSIGIHGRGFLFIGPKGAGKSTTTMALAARGHRFLGDECGAYLPESRCLIPFRRPVGIKPGPRARAIASALPNARRVVAGDGFVRVGLEELMPIDVADDAVPLAGVVYLRGFRDEPALQSIVPGREEVAAVQPIAGSLINAPGTQRVFQLVDMLANTRVYALHPGDPDATASYLEEVLSSWH